MKYIEHFFWYSSTFPVGITSEKKTSAEFQSQLSFPVRILWIIIGAFMYMLLKVSILFMIHWFILLRKLQNLNYTNQYGQTCIGFYTVIHNQYSPSEFRLLEKQIFKKAV